MNNSRGAHNLSQSHTGGLNLKSLKDRISPNLYVNSSIKAHCNYLNFLYKFSTNLVLHVFVRYTIFYYNLNIFNLVQDY